MRSLCEVRAPFRLRGLKLAMKAPRTLVAIILANLVVLLSITLRRLKSSSVDDEFEEFEAHIVQDANWHTKVGASYIRIDQL